MNSGKQASRIPLIRPPLLAGIVFSMIWLALGALLLSMMLHFTNMKESDLSTYALLVHGFSALSGGLAAGKRSERKGWYNGGALGLIYGFIVMIVSFLAANASLTWGSLLMLASVLVAGAFGGMIGVNLKR